MSENVKVTTDIEKIVKLIDSKINSGSGHINIDIDNNSETKIVDGTADCSSNPMACSIPTM